MIKALKTTAAVSTLALTLAVAASSAMAETPSWCGPNEASLALLDGFGGNSWRLVTTASGAEEAAKCPSITQYEYADGQGDTQKAISDINAMAARGIDAMVVFGDSGPAVLPALTNAYRSGTIVVPYRVNVGGEAGTNYTQFIGSSFFDDGVNWGNWIKSILPDGGNLLFLSGPAGNSQGVDERAGMESVLDDSYVFINQGPFAVTNWDPSLTQQVLSAEIAKNDNIDAVSENHYLVDYYDRYSDTYIVCAKHRAFVQRGICRPQLSVVQERIFSLSYGIQYLPCLLFIII